MELRDFSRQTDRQTDRRTEERTHSTLHRRAPEGWLPRPHEISFPEVCRWSFPGTIGTSILVTFTKNDTVIFPLPSWLRRSCLESWDQRSVKSAHPECFDKSLICSDATSLYLVHADRTQIEFKAFIKNGTIVLLLAFKLPFGFTPRKVLWCLGTVHSWNGSCLSFIDSNQYSVAPFP